MHVSPGGQLPTHRGESPPQGRSSAVVVVVVGSGVVVVVGLDVVLVAGRVVVVCVVVGRAVVVVRGTVSVVDKAGLFTFIETSVDGLNGTVYCGASPSGAFLD